MIAADRVELLDGLGALARDRSAPNVVVGDSESGVGRTVSVFPGQGAQWAGMARALLADAPVFAASIAECEQVMAGLVDWSLTDVLSGAPGAPSLERVDVVQPALFAMMVSLAALWRSWGVEPAAVVGHSQGEIAAAVVAGGLSLADGAKVVVLRSRAIGALAGRGGMVALAIGHEEAAAEIASWGGRVSVAAVNGPAAVVVSGDPDALAALVARCGERGVRTTTVPVDYASHSAQVETIRDELLTALADITPRTGRVPLFSTLTGDWLDTAEMTADYWYRNLRGTVRFEAAIGNLARQGYDVFVEVSPHPVLAVPIQDTVAAAGPGAAVVTGSLRRDDGDLRRLRTSAAELWVRGVTVDWTTAFAGAQAVGLPTYAFQERRFWPEPTERAGRADMPADNGFWDLVDRGDPEELARVLAVDAEPLGRVLPALGAWRRGRDEPADRLRYRVVWHRLADPSAAVLTGRWLLVLPAGQGQSPHARWITHALTKLGADVDYVELADEDIDRARLAARLGTATTAATAPTGIVSLLSSAERPHPEYAALPVGAALTVTLLQTLSDLGWTAPLWCVTSGSVTIGAADPLTAPRQAMVWGTGMVAALEQSQRWGGLLDLPPEPDDLARLRFGAALAGTGTVAGKTSWHYDRADCSPADSCAPRARRSRTAAPGVRAAPSC